MENFVYEYPTKVLFGKGAAKEHLGRALSAYGPNVMLAYGGGSVIDCCKVIAAQAVLEEDIWDMELVRHRLPSLPPIPMGAVMRSTIRNMRTLLQNPDGYTARGNLMWASAMAENGILKCGRATDFQAHQIEHQLGAYTDCNHGQALAVLHPSSTAAWGKKPRRSLPASPSASGRFPKRANPSRRWPVPISKWHLAMPRSTLV